MPRNTTSNTLRPPAQARDGIGRRDFMGTALAAGAAAAVLPGLMSGTARAQSPKKGGKLFVGGTATARDSLAPERFNAPNSFSTGMCVYDNLVGRDGDLRPTPWLAESFEPNADGTEWVFKLRKDVVFHDGQRFGAEDVIFSFNRIIGPDSTSPLKPVFAHVQEIKKDDDHTVKFVLSTPDVDFPLSCGDHRSVVTQRGNTTFDPSATHGTGPFKIVSYEPGVRYHVTRNDDYWGSDGPWLDEIEFRGIADQTTRLNALLANDVHCIAGVDPSAVDLIARRDDVELMTVESTTPISATMMLDRGPTDNADLRLALKFAAEREKIIDNVYKGLAHVGNDTSVSKLHPYYCDELPQRPYDPERANFHIKKAGLENVPIDLYSSDVFAGLVSAAEVFQESAAASGVNINLIKAPSDTYWDAVWLQQPLCIAYWDGRPSINIMYSTACFSTAPWNETAWRNEEFDKVLVEARGVFDQGLRQEMYCQLQRMLHDDGGYGTWAHLNYTDARRPEVQGIVPHPSGNLGFFKFARTAWLDT